jgi:ABC-type sugar transport system substrate-binding protein
MAQGARAALNAAAERLGEPRLRSVPVTGIDAVPNDGQRRLRTGDLTATVENPRTSGPAIELLATFWKRGPLDGRGRETSSDSRFSGSTGRHRW